MSKIAQIVDKVFTKLENWLGCNHINPFLTLYANLRLLPFRQALRLPVYIYGFPRLMDLSGRICLECPVRSGLMRINVIDFTPAQRGSSAEIAIRGTVCLGGHALVRSNTKIYVDRGAVLSIGHNLRMGAGVIINCLNNIVIGEGVRIGHRSQLLDSNMHFMLDVRRRRVAPLRKRIVIGGHSWLTNTVTVDGGTVLPSRSVVASGTVLNKDVTALGNGNIIGGTPLRVLSSDFRLVNNYAKEREIDAYYKANPDGEFPVVGEISEHEWFDNQL